MQRYFTVLRKWLYGKHAETGTPQDHPALISSESMIKILRKFNKMVCYIKEEKSKGNFENLQLEELKSSCLGELMAFQINTREKKNRTTSLPGQLDECKLQTSTEDQLVLSITLCNSKVLAVDLTCSICLETLFDPVSLTCSHIFCYMCACSAGSVNTTIDGLKSANPKSKCPLCRKAGVFEGAVRMHQLRKLLRRKFPEYWVERRQKEREKRIQEAKAYWEFQCRAFVGINWRLIVWFHGWKQNWLINGSMLKINRVHAAL